MSVSCRRWKRKLYYLFPSFYCGYVVYYKFQKVKPAMSQFTNHGQSQLSSVTAQPTDFLYIIPQPALAKADATRDERPIAAADYGGVRNRCKIPKESVPALARGRQRDDARARPEGGSRRETFVPVRISLLHLHGPRPAEGGGSSPASSRRRRRGRRGGERGGGGVWGGGQEELSMEDLYACT